SQTAPQAVQRLPFEVLHRDEVMPALLTYLVRLDDVRMVEARGEAGLAEGHRSNVLLVGELGAELFVGEGLFHAARTGDDGEEHLRHPPLTELRDDAIPAERPDLLAARAFRDQLSRLLPRAYRPCTRKPSKVRGRVHCCGPINAREGAGAWGPR